MTSLPAGLAEARLHTLLPKLPSVIRYYDDFSEQTYSIRNPESLDEWELIFDGQTHELAFTLFDATVRPVIRLWCAFMLCNGSAPASVSIRFAALTQITSECISALLRTDPKDLKSFWQLLLSGGNGVNAMESVKSLLRCLSSLALCGWNQDLKVLVAQLPLPKVDKFAAVRSGEVFLRVEEEAALVRAFDELAELVRKDPIDVSVSDLRRMAILACSYQFGVRRKQIAMLKMSDVRIWRSGSDDKPSVHLTFVMIKQRSADRRLPMTRRVKHDWSPIFFELLNRRRQAGAAGNDRYFGINSAADAGYTILDATRRILGHPRSATELRHTVAQRLVDAGATQEELADYMGHSSLDSGLVYFRTSPSQAERLNTALGASITYRQVVKVAVARFISPDELAKLKGTQQVGGVPHGIPISGIGGCSLGQPACPLNPVVSCYGCSKFMPVNDLAIHVQVLADLRGVVRSFYDASRADVASPTYLQLRHTIATVQQVLDELKTEGR